MGGQVERSGDERRTGHKRPRESGDGKSDGKRTESQHREREREENDSEKEHVGEEGRI